MLALRSKFHFIFRILWDCWNIDLNKETNKVETNNVIAKPNTKILKFRKALIVLRFPILRYLKDSVGNYDSHIWYKENQSLKFDLKAWLICFFLGNQIQQCSYKLWNILEVNYWSNKKYKKMKHISKGNIY